MREGLNFIAFVEAGMAAQRAVDDAVAEAKRGDESFPYFRLAQTHRHFGVTYAQVLEIVEFFDREPDAMERWTKQGGTANLRHVVALAYKREMNRRARVIADDRNPR